MSRRSLKPREKILLGLLGLVAIALYFGVGRDEVGAPENGGAHPAGAADAGLGAPPRVRMDLLDQNAAAFNPSGRNLFAYYTPPPPPVRRPPIDTTFKPQQPPPPPPPEEPYVPPAPPVPRAPLPGFRYLGYIGPKENKIAVFSFGDDLTLARVGDIVGKQFKLVEFKYESVVMGYVDEAWQGHTTELKQSAK